MRHLKICETFFLVKLSDKEYDCIVQTVPFRVFTIDKIDLKDKKSLRELKKEINKDLKVDKKNLNDFSLKSYFALDLVITTFCNLRCVYCCALSKKTKGFYGLPPQHMDIETAKNTLDFCMEAFKKEIKKAKLKSARFDCFITGGEPTLNNKTLKYLIKNLYRRIQRLAKEYNIQIDYTTEVATNATLITDELASFFAKYDVQTAVTVDGSSHNKRRVYKNGKGSLKETLTGLKKLIKKRVKIKLQSVVPVDEISMIESILKFYEKNKLLDSIKLVNIIPQGNSIFDRYLTFDKNKIKKESLNTYKRYGERVFHYSKKYNLDLKNYQERMFRSINSGGFIHRCPAGQWKISISPDGSIYPCHQLTNIKEFYMGNINKPKNVVRKEMKKVKNIFKNRLVFKTTPCKDCIFQTICIPFVDCPARCYIETGDLFQVPDYYCKVHKPYLEKLLEKFLSEKVKV